MTTSLNYTYSMYETDATDFYNGVVRVTQDGSYGTGALLYDGRSILTAAHIFENEDLSNVVVYFDTLYGTISYNATVTIYEEYDSENSNGDIAIVTLEENASLDYQRYELYRDNDEIGQIFTMVGYGAYGTGYRGEIEYSSDILKLKTQNSFDTDFYTIATEASVNLSWSPEEDAILVADFDSGYSSTDTLGELLDIEDTGVGSMEGMIASGDSGGPAFIDNMIAGVASYTSSLGNTDINYTIDSSFGEVGAWQRVSYYQEWIDKTVRANYEDAPTSRGEVETSIVEQDEDVSYTYFLLEFTEDRDSVEDNITLYYETRDGTAIEGEDYISVSGTITLYTDESFVVIPVEIIGDTKYEGNETLYLDVSEPSYGSFGEEVTTLTAMRTIIDDDLYIA